MPLRYAFWIIVAGTTPTSFKARRSEDLLPTLRQLQRTQPDTVLRWFERGRRWESPEAAREDQVERRKSTADRKRDWRPGGDHIVVETRQELLCFMPRDTPVDDRMAGDGRQVPVLGVRGPEEDDGRTDFHFRWRDPVYGSSGAVFGTVAPGL